MAKAKKEAVGWSHPLAIVNLRNAAAHQAAMSLSISFRDAKELLKDLPDDELVAICEESAKERAEASGEPAAMEGPILDNIREFLKKIDPDLKQLIIQNILKIILGL